MLTIFFTMICGQKNFQSIHLDNPGPDLGARKPPRDKLFETKGLVQKQECSESSSTGCQALTQNKYFLIFHPGINNRCQPKAPESIVLRLHHEVLTVSHKYAAFSLMRAFLHLRFQDDMVVETTYLVTTEAHHSTGVIARKSNPLLCQMDKLRLRVMKCPRKCQGQCRVELRSDSQSQFFSENP